MNIVVDGLKQENECKFNICLRKVARQDCVCQWLCLTQSCLIDKPRRMSHQKQRLHHKRMIDTHTYSEHRIFKVLNVQRVMQTRSTLRDVMAKRMHKLPLMRESSCDALDMLTPDPVCYICILVIRNTSLKCKYILYMLKLWAYSIYDKHSATSDLFGEFPTTNAVYQNACVNLREKYKLLIWKWSFLNINAT